MENGLLIKRSGDKDDSEEKIKVLHIDDDQDFLDLFKLTFSGYFNIKSALGGEEAFTISAEEDFDCIITDYEMDSINGLQVLKKIRDIKPEIPIIFYTGQGNEEIAREAFISGAFDYFTKDIFGYVNKEKFLNSVIRSVQVRRAEEAKSRSEQIQRGIFEESPIAVAIVGLDYSFLKVNPVFCIFTKYRREWLLKNNLFDIIHPDDAHTVRAAISRLLNGETGQFHIDNRYIREDGTIAWGRLSLRLVRDAEDGRPLYFLPMIVDITERIRAEEALAENERKFRAVFNNANDIVVLHEYVERMPGRIIEANDKMCKILGYSRDELKSMTIMDITPEEHATDYKNMSEQIGRDFMTKGWSKFEAVAVTREGMRILVEINSHVFNLDGRKVILSIARDITNRKTAEEELRLSNEKFKNLAESINDIIFSADACGVITYVSPQVEKYGIRSEDIVGRNFYHFVHEDDLERIIKELERSFWEGFEQPSQLRLIFPDGNFYWFEDHSRTLRDENGHPVGITGVLRDIGERKKIEESLRQSEMKYRDLVENAVDPIYTIGLNGMIQDANEAFFKATGIKRENLHNIYFKAIVHPDDFPVVDEAFEKAIKGEHVNIEIRARMADGSYGWFSTVNRPLKNSEGEVVSIHGIGRDITDRKNMEQELINRNRELNDFSYRVSHDLKNSVNIMRGYLNLINEKPEAFYDYYSLIMNHSNHLLKFIDDLLKLSRAGRIIAQKEQVNLGVLFKRVFHTHRSPDLSEELKIKGELPTIWGDSQGIEQVISNLILNSFKYRDPDKSKLIVEVTSKLDEDNCIIMIKDNGIGIRDEYKDKIFIPGFTVAKDKGTGFGLAIAEKIVKAHNGKISAQSEGDKKGAEFCIQFPTEKS